jgi:hypothetical protein
MLELYNGKIQNMKKIKKMKEELKDNNIINVITKGFLEVDQKKRLKCADALSILSRNEYINLDKEPGIDPDNTIKKIAKRFNINNDLTLRMASLYVKKTGCHEKWALILATKLFEVEFFIPEEKDEYQEAD